MSVRARNAAMAGAAIVCAAAASPVAAQDTAAGVWDATMMVGEHTLCFAIDIPAVAGREATISLQGVRTASASVRSNDEEILVEFPRYGARIRATRIGERLYGEWIRERTVGETVTIERLEFSALRSRSDRAPEESEGSIGPVAAPLKPLPLRWNSEPDECGSAHAYSIRSEGTGAVVARTVSAEGRLVHYVGRWSDATQTLTLGRFDGEEAEIIVATREGDGRLSGQYWLGAHMPLPWVVHPIVTATPMESNAESRGTIAYP